jgi:hypothetical protein
MRVSLPLANCPSAKKQACEKPTEAHRNSLSLEVFEAGARSDK